MVNAPSICPTSISGLILQQHTIPHILYYNACTCIYNIRNMHNTVLKQISLVVDHTNTTNVVVLAILFTCLHSHRGCRLSGSVALQLEHRSQLQCSPHHKHCRRTCSLSSLEHCRTDIMICTLIVHDQKGILRLFCVST